jgi:hypothetical protein
MKTTVWLFSFTLLSLSACEIKENDIKRTTVQGNWALSYGELNGHEAPALEKIYFTFTNDTLRTNFTTSEQDETATYHISESTLLQKTGEPIEYQILQLNDSLMEMTTELRGFDFKLVLHRQ